MRWVLALWCVFLLSAGAQAENCLRFLVKDGRTQRPIPGAVVYFCSADDDERQLLTDSQGRGEFRRVSTMPLNFTARALINGVGYRAKHGTLALDHDQVLEVKLTLLPLSEVIQPARWKQVPMSPWQEPKHPKPGKLTFQVRDAVTGAPLPYISILLKGPDITEPVGEEDTDIDGTAVRETPPGTYHYAVVAFVDGIFYRRQYGEITVEAGKQAMHTIYLHPQK